MSELPPAKKSLGQNFLVDPNIARKLVDALQIKPGETVLEIGPGAGALTEPLLAQTERVIAVEIDDRLLPLLRERFGKRLELIHADILDVDLAALAKKENDRLAVLGNLPYYSSSPILFHLLRHRAFVSRAVLTLQREVVDRCCADPGGKDYGTLSIYLALAAEVRRLFTMSPQVFRPRPKVDSAAMLVDFTKPDSAQPRSWSDLEKVVRAAFGQRRKTLRNALGARFGVEKASQLLDEAGIEPGLRAEAVPPAGFVALADALTGGASPLDRF